MYAYDLTFKIQTCRVEAKLLYNQENYITPSPDFPPFSQPPNKGPNPF